MTVIGAARSTSRCAGLLGRRRTLLLVLLAACPS